MNKRIQQLREEAISEIQKVIDELEKLLSPFQELTKRLQTVIDERQDSLPDKTLLTIHKKSHDFEEEIAQSIEFMRSLYQQINHFDPLDKSGEELRSITDKVVVSSAEARQLIMRLTKSIREYDLFIGDWASKLDRCLFDLDMHIRETQFIASLLQSAILENLTSMEAADGPNVETVSKVHEVHFSSFAPHSVKVEQRYSIFVYAHLGFALNQVQSDVKRFQKELGDAIPQRRTAKNRAKIRRGTLITIVPESDEITFSPQILTKSWDGDWTRFEFDFRPSDNLAGDVLFVRTSVQIAGIEIAHIKFALEVVESEETAVQQISDSNPLLEHKLRSQTVTPYQRIFISYSRRDSSVAKSYKVAQTALGNDAFLDVDNLRAGEDWRAALARAIDEADIFQLFWSEHSASSEYCRYEWDYALKVRCPDDNCEGFIRPVYWRRPMPSPPSELRRINFRFVPFEDQED